MKKDGFSITLHKKYTKCRISRFDMLQKSRKSFRVFRKVLLAQLKFKLSFLFKALLCFHVSHTYHSWTSLFFVVGIIEKRIFGQ